MTVFNFGSINIDYVYRIDRFVQPGETLASNSLETVLGGKGANQSVALARAGAEVKHIGRISNSDSWAKESLADFGVDVSGIELQNTPSGHAIIQVDEQGENAIILHGGANISFDESSLRRLLASAEPNDWLLIQNECNALNSVFEIAAEKQLNVAFNPAPMHSSVTDLPLTQCKLLVLNEVEAEQLTGLSLQDQALHEELQTRFPDCAIALTLGAEGATLIHQGITTHVSAPKVEVVDSTGAGDTFVGYFLQGLIEELDPELCLQRACAAGALAVTIAGATPSIPNRSAVDHLFG